MKLEYLDLAWNTLNGSLPKSICPSSGSSLVNLLLTENQLSGMLNLTGCSNLVLVDVSMNNLVEGSNEAVPTGPSSNRHLSVVLLLGTNVRR